MGGSKSFLRFLFSSAEKKNKQTLVAKYRKTSTMAKLIQAWYLLRETSQSKKNTTGQHVNMS